MPKVSVYKDVSDAIFHGIHENIESEFNRHLSPDVNVWQKSSNDLKKWINEYFEDKASEIRDKRGIYLFKIDASIMTAEMFCHKWEESGNTFAPIIYRNVEYQFKNHDSKDNNYLTLYIGKTTERFKLALQRHLIRKDSLALKGRNIKDFSYKFTFATIDNSNYDKQLFKNEDMFSAFEKYYFDKMRPLTGKEI